MTKILAFDLAGKTGVAFGAPGDTPLAWSFGLSGAPEQKFASMMRLLQQIIRERGPSHIAFEQPFSGPSATVAKSLFGYRAIAMGMAAWHRIPVAEVNISKARSHFIGHGALKGAAAKAAVSERCSQLGWAHQNLDESDALAVWSYHASQLSPDHANLTMRLMDGQRTTGGTSK